MGLLAEYEITCEGLPLVDVAATVPAATLEIEFQPSEKRYTAFVVEVVDGDPQPVEQAFDSASFVEEYIPFRQENETPTYRIEPAIGIEESLGEYVDDVSELQSLAAADADITYMRATPMGWIQRGWFADRATLDRFWSFWDRNGEFTLRRLVPHGDTGESETGLTDRQRAAVVTAYEMGYFDIPRRASLAEVADELEITASSLSERLRRAQSHLIETTVPRRIDS